jgi:hypothetical protein
MALPAGYVTQTTGDVPVVDRPYATPVRPMALT